MEHLYLPSGAPLRKWRTQWRGHDDYIGVKFADYAQIKGFGFLLTPVFSKPLEQLLEENSIEDKQILPFLNTWLFGSLLYNFFESVSTVDGAKNLYIHDEFLREEVSQPDKPAKRFFCTTELMRLLDDWVQRVSKIGQERAKAIYGDLHFNLAIVFNALKLIGLESCQFPRLLKIVAITCDMLSLTLDRTFPNEEPQSLPWALFGWGEADIDRMISLGWCPKEAHSLFGQMPALQALLFYGNMSRYYQRASHASCQKELCVASYGNNTLPSHFEANCTCKRSLGLEGSLKEDALDIIEQGGIAIIKLTVSDKVTKMEIMEASAVPDMSYVAISHVWSDGMGNPNANLLPICRLEYLFDSVSTVQAAELSLDKDGSEMHSVYFWIDTICCPISPLWAKERVLSKMRDIYEKAKKVLVLDWELAGLEVSDMQDLEIAGRVLRSNWTRRLWTLQEGFLAQNLVVQFSDEDYELDAVKKLDLDRVDINAKWVATAVKGSFWSIRKRLAKDDEAEEQALVYLFMSTLNRSVTVRSDESLCLAAFLGLDVSEILNVKEDERMASFWRLLDRSAYKVPKAILFYEGPKLNFGGLTWAPSTLLRNNCDAAFMGQLGPGSPKALSIGAEGLIVQSDCAALKPPPRDEALAKAWNSDSADEEDFDVVKFRDTYSGKWYNLLNAADSFQSLTHRVSMASLESLNRLNSDPNCLRNILTDQKYTGYALIFPKDILSLNEQGVSSISALIGIKRNPKDEKAKYARKISTVQVNQASPEDDKIFEFAYQMTQTFLRISEHYESYKRTEDSEADQRHTRREAQKSEAPLKYGKGRSESLREISDIIERQKGYIDEMLLILGSSGKSNALREALHEFVESALARNPRIADLLERTYGKYSGRRKLYKITREICVGSFHIDALPLPGDTQWCVD